MTRICVLERKKEKVHLIGIITQKTKIHMTWNERNQCGQEKSLLARQSSCPEKPNSEIFLKRCSTTITALKNFTYVKHYYRKTSLSA